MFVMDINIHFPGRKRKAWGLTSYFLSVTLHNIINGGKAPMERDMDKLLTELEQIRDKYKIDVKQFIGFVRENKLTIVEGLSRYAAWLAKSHGGKRYSPSTINRKISAAKNRVR
jgi:hypothetical protein